MKGRWVLAAIAAAFLAMSTASADQLLIETIQKDGTMQRPERGMTMERVREAFGTPQTRQGAVGEPPITRWQYESFTVYFEHDRVIHAVARR
ncbi:hypothetical protein H0Z60_21125 [Ectothiorhodospiraceae bacterium WFHF3C12]|nr:hypothetical protein [Ectothiorhodospiraceae bacterium WFHF3C12]